MKTIEFEISSGELFCLAAIQGFGYLLNVDYEHEESEADLLSLFNELSEKLRNKKWLDEDFDGNITVTKEMQKAISLCAVAERFWVIQNYVKNETIADYIYTVYNSGDDYLVLEQIDGENYNGMLAGSLEAVKDNILSKVPFSESTHLHEEFSSDEVESLTEGKQYSLITMAKYTVDTMEEDDNESSFIHHNAGMFLFLKNGGSYKLSILEEEPADGAEDESEDEIKDIQKKESGSFLPITKQEYFDNIDSILTDKEDI